MNQVIKRVIYTKGTPEQVDYIAKIGGMSDDEREVLRCWHDAKTDLFMQEEIGCDKKALSDIEICTRMKVAIAVFRCIDRCMEMDKKAQF